MKVENRSEVEAGNSCPCEKREEFVRREGRLHLVADWDDVVFMNYRIEPSRLQPFVPFPLETCQGSAWVSLVAFTMRNVRPSLGGRFTESLFRPFRTQRFLNVRTYVKVGEGRGIHFIAEWISDWLNAFLGPITYGLPYRHGRLTYRHDAGKLKGEVRADGDELLFDCDRGEGQFGGCFDELGNFLLERYTAYNAAGGIKRLFRVWHEPWEQTEAETIVSSDGLLRGAFTWWKHAEFAGSRFSPGAKSVLMGMPRKAPNPPR